MEIKIGIKQLVEFILRSGSIDSRFTGTDRALLGAKIHRKLQKAAGKDYIAEKSLSIELCEGDILYRLHGRADGIIFKDGKYIIDEIKTVSTPLEFVDENYSRAHWAQGCFYGYIICKENEAEAVTIQLTYYNIDTDEIKRIAREYTFRQLESEVYSVLKEYRKWALLSASWQEERNKSLKQLQFPFAEYRPGQRPMAVSVYNTIRKSDRLFLCAPTGTGKTMSTVFPSLKAMGEGLCDKLFYLTAKTVTARAATDAVKILYDKMPGLALKSINITAKDKVCFLEKRNCNPGACPYARGYYDKINDILYEEIKNGSVFSQQAIMDTALKNSLCPYELSLDISEWCDVIICDYNYLFDPTVHLQRFFDVKKGEYVFLIDEVHNLPDRAREMYSAYLDKKTFFEIKKNAEISDKKLKKALNGINNVFIEYRHRFDDIEENHIVRETQPQDMEKRLRNFVKTCADYFDRNKDTETDEKLLAAYFDTKFFLRIFEEFDEKYVTLFIKSKDNISVRLFCTDPSRHIDNALSAGRRAVAFSATLNPINYYRQIAGGKGEAVYVPSPFSQHNMGLFVADSISTKYKDREQTVDEICRMLYTMCSAKKGNYIAYFPSYAYMNIAYRRYSQLYPERNTALQTQGMTDEERAEYISLFDIRHPDGLLGFCVMGGIYGEGIDLTGDRLIGCAVVGVGLPQINVQQDTLKDYYDKNGYDGFAYAYQYPGMNKVMQAAGRVIRTAEDRGTVLLIDSRFTTRRYLENMPAHWSHLRVVKNSAELDEKLKIFWNKKDGSD